MGLDNPEIGGQIEYPEQFLNLLQSEWSKVCQLMEWNENGVPPDFENFKSNKDLTTEVKNIQNKILEKSGQLPKYGMDGKFGPETQVALNEILNVAPEVSVDPIQARADLMQSSAEEILEAEALSSGSVVDLDDTMSDAEAKTNIKMERMKSMFGVISKVDENLRKAGLIWKSKEGKTFATLSPMEIDQYVTNADNFRGDLVKAEPRLNILRLEFELMRHSMLDKLKNLDLSKVTSGGDIMMELLNIFSEMDETEEMNSKNFNSLMEEVGVEPVMTLFMSYILEFSLHLEQKIKGSDLDPKMLGGGRGVLQAS